MLLKNKIYLRQNRTKGSLGRSAEMRNGKLRNDETESETAARSVPRNEDNSDFFYSVAALIVLVVLTIIGFFVIGKYFMNNLSFSHSFIHFIT